ncbi:MAG: AsmA family protein [Haliea sp.]|jgi:uncharacterized protein involved in outer membrane biogenesis|nr:AsmA family protein [Haliea sp.]
MPRLILIPLILVALLVLAAIVLVPLFLDEEKVLEIASTQLREQTGATLTVGGDTSLSLFPVLGVSLQQAAIAMPGEEQASISARALSIGVQMMPLLSGRVEIDSIRLDGLNASITSAPEQPAIDTGKMTDRELDAFYDERRKARKQAGDTAGAEAALSVPLALKVRELTITDARLETVDPESEDISVLEIPRLEATGLNLDQTPIPLSMELRVPGEEVISVLLEGELRVSQQQQVVQLDNLEVQVNGVMAQPVNLQTSGEVDINRQVADLKLSLHLGEAQAKGKVRYASFESPQVDAILKLNQFSPALLALAGPEAASADATETTAASGDEPLPLDAIRLIDTRARLAIEQAVFEPHVVTDVKVSLRAKEGVITVDTFTGKLHGGELDLTATFNGKHNTASLVTEGKVDALDIATALAAMESEPVFSGSASLDWKLNGRGRTPNELVAALKGPINLTTAEPALRGMSVEGMLCQAVALVNQESLTTTFPADTRFQTLGAALTLDDGKLNLKPLKAQLPQIQLTGSGSLDLLSQNFKTTFKARLSPELEQLDRACRVSKRLTAIDWPVKCKGNTADDPGKWCGVDTEQIIEDMAKNEAKRKVEKEAGKLLDKLFK